MSDELEDEDVGNRASLAPGAEWLMGWANEGEDAASGGGGCDGDGDTTRDGTEANEGAVEEWVFVMLENDGIVRLSPH